MMQLINVRVNNFRSLRDVSVQLASHTALIGGNGAGKSSLLKAIERFYSSRRSLEPDDYFGRDTTLTVEIELTFGDLSAEEAEIFQSRVRDGQLVVTRVFDESTSSGRYFGSVLQNPDFVAVRQHAGAGARRDAYRALRADNPAYSELPAASSAVAAEEAMLEWEAQHPDQLELERDDGQFFGFQNAGRGALQRHTSFVFVPAVREAAADAADGKNTAIGQLLELVVRSTILEREEFQRFREELAARYQRLVAPENLPELGLLAGLLTRGLRGLYQDAEVGLTWRQLSDFEVPLPTAEVSLSDDGFGGPVDRQGHGLQRAFILTLLQHLARRSQAVPAAPPEGGDAGDEQLVAQAPSLILAIEEPELYQHPTKQRHFAEVLRLLSEGALPGVESQTQVLYASHSPLFVSLSKADEIRLVRRTDCEDSDYKQCELRALDLRDIVRELDEGYRRRPGSSSVATLIPRLHVLGSELAEGFFANGIVLVEGRSDKAALAATARALGQSFEASGIAILSAEGKGNLDKPLLIFRALGIPTYVVWDCDRGTQEPVANLALLRLMRPAENLQEAPPETVVAESYAHFEDTLERVLRQELSEGVYNRCLVAACEPLGLTASKDAQKVPEVMYRMLAAAKEQGATAATLEAIVRASWQHICGAPFPAAEQR